MVSSHHQRLWPTETEIDWLNAFYMFFILHFLLYPASNGYNSYFDKDKQSIGGLKTPPQVSKELYFVSLALDVIAIIWGLFIDWKVSLMLLVYGLVSKAYSHPSIRLKKLPFIGWFIAGIFQGAFTFIMVIIAVSPQGAYDLVEFELVLSSGLTTLLLWGSFPMTQVYQHGEDAERGDRTISRILGIRGTFIFTMGVFLLANLLFMLFFLYYENKTVAYGFQLAMLPIVGYFLYWFRKVWEDTKAADYTNTMRLNFISALSLNIFFSLWLFLSS
jgi:1,4-dihydroxy-2-naphthoate octaprenyltransferase